MLPEIDTQLQSQLSQENAEYVQSFGRGGGEHAYKGSVAFSHKEGAS